MPLETRGLYVETSRNLQTRDITLIKRQYLTFRILFFDSYTLVVACIRLFRTHLVATKSCNTTNFDTL